MMRKLRFDHNEGELIPLGWAVSHRDFMRRVSVCYPIGIHFIVRWSRNILYWLMDKGYPSWRQELEHKIYLSGLQEGEEAKERLIKYGIGKYSYNRGKAEGYDEGLRQGQELVIRKLEEEIEKDD